MPSFDYFRQLDAPDLIINIWSYSNYIKENLTNCHVCKSYVSLYTNLSKEALSEKWEKSWGDFHFVVKKLEELDKNFIDISSYSNANKHA